MFARSFIAAALAALSFAAAAQQAPASTTYYGENSGRTQIIGSMYGASSGVGGSQTHVEATATSYSNVQVYQRPADVGIAVQAGGTTAAMGYNGSFGNGSGNYKVDQWSDASGFGSASLVIPTGWIQVGASVDGGRTNAVRNGTDGHISGGTNTDVFARADYAGTAASFGNLTATPIAGGWDLKGALASSTSADGTAVTGRVTFPAGSIPSSAGNGAANTGVEFTATGSFDDPAKK